MGMIQWGQKSKPRNTPKACNKTPQKYLHMKYLLTPRKSHILKQDNETLSLNIQTTIEQECDCPLFAEEHGRSTTSSDCI